MSWFSRVRNSIPLIAKRDTTPDNLWHKCKACGEMVFAKEFEDLECTPSNPMGKVLVLDMVLNVAKYGGEGRFEQGGEWAKKFALMTAAALDRPAVRVDVASFVVG